MASTKLTEDRFAAQFALAYHAVMGQQLPDGFRLDQPLIDIDLDSISRLEIVQRLEEQLGVDIDDAVIKKVKTAADLFRQITTGGATTRRS
jgi:acyl carrier protein